MDVIQVHGGASLKGSVAISGSKNACLPIFAATMLTSEPCIIRNVPDLSDVRFMLEIMGHMGVAIEQVEKGVYRVEAKDLTTKAPYDLVRKMRASICLLGPLVGRLGYAEISLPGGCVIGQRPIDLHLSGLKRMGCEVEMRNGYVFVDGAKRRGSHVFLGGRQGSTVTGTANILMAAVLTPGVTRLESAACEPEVEDLCRMLVAMGAKIDGIGSHSLLIEGVDRLNGVDYAVIPDRIEAGTYIAAGLLPGNEIVVTGARAEHLGSFLHYLDDGDITVQANGDILVKGHEGRLKPKEVITLPYPGYPTDLQAQLMSILCVTPGISIITERIYPNRFMHVPELLRMGAHISIEGTSAIINGQEALWGAPVMASDLRASAALVLAGLVARGETVIQRVYHIDRGYEDIDGKLRALGAEINRVPADSVPLEMAM